MGAPSNVQRKGPRRFLLAAKQECDGKGPVGALSSPGLLAGMCEGPRDIQKKAAGRRALRQALYHCDVWEGGPPGGRRPRPSFGLLARRLHVGNAAAEDGVGSARLGEACHRSGPRRGAGSPLPTRLCLGAQQTMEQQLLAPGTIYVHVSVFGESLPVSSRAPLQLLLFLDSRLSPPTEGKKKKKGHVCLEKYVGQWNISCTGAK